jgi:hypothetical protein
MFSFQLPRGISCGDNRFFPGKDREGLGGQLWLVSGEEQGRGKAETRLGAWIPGTQGTKTESLALASGCRHSTWQDQVPQRMTCGQPGRELGGTRVQSTSVLHTAPDLPPEVCI